MESNCFDMYFFFFSRIHVTKISLSTELRTREFCIDLWEKYKCFRCFIEKTTLKKNDGKDLYGCFFIILKNENWN